MSPSKTGALAVAVAATLGVSACGEKTVKTADIEKAVGSQYKQKGTMLHDVACDDDVKAKKDTRFNCSAVTSTDTKLDIDGTVTKVTGDRAKFDLRIAGGVAQGARLAAKARELLERQAGQLLKGMTCPPTVRIPTKQPVQCKIETKDGQTYATALTVDKNAQIRVQVAQQPEPTGG